MATPEHHPLPYKDHDQLKAEAADARRARRIKGLAGATAIGLLGYGFGGWLAGFKPRIEITSSVAQATRLRLDPIELQCNTREVWEVKNAEFHYQVKIKEYDIPGFGATVSYPPVEPKRGSSSEELKTTKIVIDTCQSEPSKYLEATQITSDENGNKIVKVPVDSIVVHTDIPAGNNTAILDPDDGYKLIGGVASVIGGASGIATAACRKIPKLPDEVCPEFGDKIDHFKRRIDADAVHWSDDALLTSFRTKVVPKEWADTKAAIVASYQKQAATQNPTIKDAANRVIVKFVDNNGNETDKIPQFIDTYKDLRDQGVLDHPDIVVEKSNTEFIISTPSAPAIGGKS